MMLSRPVVTAGVVAMVLSSVLCASLPSHTDHTLAERRHKRRVDLRQRLPIGIGSPDIPSAKGILFILREKCRQWRDQGNINLPSYCYVLESNANSVPPNQLNGFYDAYASQVSAAERFQDLQRASPNRRNFQ